MGKKAKELKIDFFRRLYYSITNFESYIIIATEKVGRSFLYLTELLIIFAVIVSIPLSYKTAYLVENNDETVNQAYKQVVDRYGLSEESKQGLIEMIKGNSQAETFFRIFGITIFVVFGIYYISAMLDVVALSLVRTFNVKNGIYTIKIQSSF